MNPDAERRAPRARRAGGGSSVPGWRTGMALPAARRRRLCSPVVASIAWSGSKGHGYALGASGVRGRRSGERQPEIARRRRGAVSDPPRVESGGSEREPTRSEARRAGSRPPPEAFWRAGEGLGTVDVGILQGRRGASALKSRPSRRQGAPRGGSAHLPSAQDPLAPAIGRAPSYAEEVPPSLPSLLAHSGPRFGSGRGRGAEGKAEGCQ
jgi:hypothetical protein